MDLGTVGVTGVVFAIVAGLMITFGVNITLGTVWGYVDEHRQTGGDLADPVFLAPFALAAVAGVAATVLVTAYPPLAAGRMQLLALQVGYLVFVCAFCAFVLGIGAVAVVTNLRAGYEDAQTERVDGQ